MQRQPQSTHTARRLTREHRVLTAADFVRILRTGKRRNGKMFTLHYKATARRSARLGLAVSRRVAARANRRNTIKRILRESFRHHLAELPAVDIVFVCRSAAAQANKAQLRSACDQALQTLVSEVRAVG